MRKLSGLDAAFIYTESPTNHMHMASLAVVDPATMPGGYDFARIRELVLQRLPLVPPFRWRLVQVPLPMARPVWIEDPHFDLDFHLHHDALLPPGGDAELAAYAADVFGRPLDRDHPLWEMHVVEGLASGEIAVVTKTHHAVIDGVSGAELTAKLLDVVIDPPPLPAPERAWRPDRVPSEPELLVEGMIDLAGRPLAAARTLARTVEMVCNLARRNRQPGVRTPPAPFQAPKTMLNGPISGQRAVAFTRLDLEDIKRVKRHVGGTVNDVVVALCAGALRRYLQAHDDLPERPLVGGVPISVRAEHESGTLGNKVSAMLVSLATDVADPLERLAAIQDATAAAKDQDKAIGASTLADWAEFLAPAVAARAARVLASTPVMDRLGPIVNVVISNVPGPNFPLYLAGARLDALFPMGPIVDGVALNMTVMSYLGTMFFGLVACRETVPDVDLLARGLEEALCELLDAVSALEAEATS